MPNAAFHVPEHNNVIDPVINITVADTPISQSPPKTSVVTEAILGMGLETQDYRSSSCQGVHDISFWPLSNVTMVRDFLARHGAAGGTPQALIMPDIRGVLPIPVVRRFVVWITNRLWPRDVTHQNVQIPWDDIHVRTVHRVDHAMYSGTSTSDRDYWKDKQLLDLAEEHTAMCAASMVYQRIRDIDKYSPVLNRASTYLAKRGAGQSGGVLNTLQAYFRLASTLTIGSDAQALQWAADFVVPEGVAQRDAAVLQTVKESPTPLEDIARLSFTERRQRRLNSTRIQDIVDEPEPSGLSGDKVWNLDDIRGDISTLLGFALHGVPTLRDTISAQISGWAGRPPLRARYVSMAPVVNKSIITGWWKPGLAIILPASLLVGDQAIVHSDVASRIHVSSLHHVLQVSKTQGRTLADGSNDLRGPDFNLNGPITKQLCKEEFGAIALPTMAEICRMILKFIDKVGPQAAFRVVLAKGDLKGAFSLLDLRPAHASLNAFEMLIHGTSYVYIPLAGYFGWTGFPYAFGVVSRVLQRIVQRSIMGDVRIYVDDLIVVTLAEHVNYDLTIMTKVSCDLLGAGSMAEDKFDTGRQLDILGWEIDLDSMTVRTSERNFLKGMYWFWKVSAHGGPVTLEEAQKVAAYGQRYSLVCPMMTPFLGPLYRMQAKLQWRQHSGKLELEEDYRQAVGVWLSSLCMMHMDAGDPWTKATIATVAASYPEDIDEDDTAVWTDSDTTGGTVTAGQQDQPPSSIFHIVIGATSSTIQVDGCLYGVGFIHWGGWWNGDRGGQVIAYGFLKFDDLLPQGAPAGGLGISDRQNSSELFSILYGSLYVASNPQLDQHGCHLVSDSLSALTWVHRRKWTGKPDTVRSSVAFMLLFLKHGFKFAEFTHVTSAQNHMADALSRGVVPEGCQDSNRWGKPGTDSRLDGLLRLLHPLAHTFCPEVCGPDVVDVVDAAFTGVVAEWPSFPDFYGSGRNGSWKYGTSSSSVQH